MVIGVLLQDNPPEIYAIRLVGNSFMFEMRTALCEYVWGYARGRELLGQSDTSTNTNTDTVSLTVDLPIITFPNHAHKKLDWEAIGKAVEQIQSLLQCATSVLYEGVSHEFVLSEHPQLITIETSYQKNADFHGCGLAVGFSPYAVGLLARAYVEGALIRESEQVVFDTYFGLTVSRKRELEEMRKLQRRQGQLFSGINVSVRNRGVPHFIVPGNCACLGANPDEFVFDHELLSHNLDTPLQQIAMLAGVVSFWNDVLKPLHVLEKQNV